MRRRLILAAGALVLALPVLAERRDEEHAVAGQLVRITGRELLEVLTLGPTPETQVELLSGADIEILALAADAESAALIGAPVLVVSVTGTHSCDEGDALAHYVVALDKARAEGPVTSCGALSVAFGDGRVTLTAVGGEVHAWTPAAGWT